VLLLALVVLAALVAVVALVRHALRGDEKAPTTLVSTPATTTPPITPDPTTSTTPPADAGVPECAPPALTVAIVADSAEVAAGVSPTFTVTITNTGADPCLVDAGEAFRQVVVVSGEDRVWASTDCVAADASRRTLLLAGAQADVTQLAWNRVRSAEGCPGGLPAPGAGTYQATVSLAGATAGPAVFVLH
jgi:hypothetical protein